MPDYINIRTAQNVEIKYKLAGLGNRILAKLIDFVILFAYFILMSYIIGSLELFGFMLYVFFLPVYIYTLMFEIYNSGQTPGKSVMKIKVVSLDGTPLSLGQIVTRWLMQLVDIWIISGLPGLIAIIAGSKQQRLGDMAAGTIVVSLKQEASLAKTAYTNVEDSYNPTYTQASQLAEQDIRIIKTVLSDRSDNRFELMTKAAEKIQEIMEVRKSTSSQEFLKIVVKDYNYYQQDRSEGEEFQY